MIKINMDKDKWWPKVFFSIIAIVAQIFIYVSMGASIAFLIIYHLAFSVLLIRILISEGRTFSFDEEGYTITFFRYQKRYFWKDLKVKRVEFIHHYPTKMAVFAPYQIYKPGRWDASNYSFWVHPLSFVYIRLRSKQEIEFYEKNKNSFKYNFYYEEYMMEEELFFEKMKEWNVELEIMKKPLKVR